jgi:hypothetical protein
MATLREIEDALRAADAAGNREDVLALAAERDRLLTVATASATAPPGKSVGDRVADSWVGGAVRGARDAFEGPAQMAARTLDAVGLAPAGMSTAFQNAIDAGDKNYRENWRQGKDLGFDGGRLLGNAGALLALSRFGPAPGAGSSLLSLAGQGAKAGFAGGLMQPVFGATDNADYWKQKGLQQVASTVTGGLVNPAVVKTAGAIGQGVNSIVNKFKAWVAPKGDAQVNVIIEQALQQHGLDPAKVSVATLESMRQQVQAAMSQTGAVSPGAVARAADFQEAGIKPLRSWITRDPVQWTQEANLSGVAGVGEDLMRRTNAATNTILDMVDRNAPKSVAGKDTWELGKVAAGGVQKVEDSMKRNVDELYNRFRDVAPDAVGDAPRFVNRASTMLEANFVNGQLPPGFQSALQGLANGKQRFDISMLYQLRQAANEQLKAGPNPALRVFKDAIDAEMDQMAGEFAGVGLARDVLKSATGMAKNRFKLQEAVPAFKLAAEGKLAPDNFFRDHVAGAKVNEVARLWQEVQDPVARDALRAAMIEYLKRAAVGSARQDSPALAQASFNKVLQADGMKQKLQIILGEQGLSDVQRAGRLAEAVIRAPSGNKVNTSNTSQAVINATSRWLQNTPLGQIPFVGPAMTTTVNSVKANAAMNPGPSAFAARSPFGVVPDDVLRRYSGLLSAPAGAFAAGEFSH